MEELKKELASVAKERDELKSSLALAQAENKRLAREHREMSANCESYREQIAKLGGE